MKQITRSMTKMVELQMTTRAKSIRTLCIASTKMSCNQQNLQRKSQLIHSSLARWPASAVQPPQSTKTSLSFHHQVPNKCNCKIKLQRLVRASVNLPPKLKLNEATKTLAKILCRSSLELLAWAINQ